MVFQSKPKDVLVNQQTYFVIYPNEEDVYNIEVNLEEIKKISFWM